MREKRLSAILGSFFILLALGLAYTQVLRWGYYSRMSKNNSIRIIPIDSPRGTIFDRNRTPVVSNRLSFDVAVIYQELGRNREKLMRALDDITGISRPRILRALEKASRKPYAPVTIVEDIEKDKALALEEASVDIDGLVIENRSKRHYLYNDVGGHIFGYLSEITEDELQDLKDYGYRARDLVGREGLEKYYNMYLTGVDGGVQIAVDNKGREIKVLGMKEPSSGKDLYLTIDISLQETCDKLLAERNGAIIVMNPQNGEVLALTSHPSFDPNVFIKPQDAAERLRLLKDVMGKPLLNRALSGLYAPGSVFKIVVASAALDTGRINSNTHFFCGGSYRLGNAKFDCWKEEGHLSQDVVDGLKHSCNVFFYNTGRVTGADNIEAYAKLFGFGKATAIDLPDEAKGLVPGRLWKRLYKNENWYEGETLNYAIGQGYLLVTPIQILQMMAVMANRGAIVHPHIAKRIGSIELAAVKAKRPPLKEGTINKVRKGLYDVVNSEDGTGKRARIEGVKVAGKTGTAQNPQGRTHGWFAGFAPYDEPSLCLVVFLEHGGKGGLEASEIAKGIFEAARNKGYL